jgi:23S rRNA (guanosine2251-2'-O)-methyltransferase
LGGTLPLRPKGLEISNFAGLSAKSWKGANDQSQTISCHEPATNEIILKPTMQTVGRLNALLEVVRSSPRRVNKIFVDRTRRSGKIHEIVLEARAQKIPLAFVPGDKLNELDRDHQGAVALLSLQEYSSLEAILAAAANPFLVLLDEVEDPQNLGAILRSAEAAGVDGVILPERRSASLTDSVLSVSAGASTYLKVARVKNLAQSMDRLKDQGLWLVGAEKDGEGAFYEFDYTTPTGLVFGSEGSGLRPLIRRKCDRILAIPQRGRVNSLNVASAASVFLFEVVRQRLAKTRAGRGGDER